MLQLAMRFCDMGTVREGVLVRDFWVSASANCRVNGNRLMDVWQWWLKGVMGKALGSKRRGGHGETWVIVFRKNSSFDWWAG